MNEGPGNCQQLHTVSLEAGPVLIDIDLMSAPSEVGHTNNNVDVLKNQDNSQLTVDLRSEAKMAAEVCSLSISFTNNPDYLISQLVLCLLPTTVTLDASLWLHLFKFDSLPGKSEAIIWKENAPLLCFPKNEQMC